MSKENINKEQQSAAEQAAAEAQAPAKETKSSKKESRQDKKVAELSDKLAALQESYDKLKAEKTADYMRLMAEFDTFRRRSAEEKLNLVSVASADTIKELLPVLDACESALKMLEHSSDAAALEGTQLIYNKLMESLKKRGLSIIEAKGQKFDADLHEAIAQIPAPTEDLKGVILDVTRTGYSLNGKVIRYPQVVVGC